MALAEAADTQQWDEVCRLLRAGPRPSLPNLSETLESAFFLILPHFPMGLSASRDTELKGTVTVR